MAKKRTTARARLKKLMQEPGVFEHVEKHVEKVAKETEYDRIADRVLKAVREINDALEEAHKCAEMRVFLGARPYSKDGPMQFDPQIYRMTHSTLALTVKFQHQDGSEMQWVQVKDERFKDAAGQGWRALQKKDRNAEGVSGAS